MTAWVMVTVSYKSQRVSSFHSSFSTLMSIEMSAMYMSAPDSTMQLTELSDTFKGKLILLNENPDGVPHELLSDVKDLRGHGGGKEDDLGLSGEELEDLVDGLLETGGKHLIGLVKAEHHDGLGLKSTSVDHVKDTTGGTNNDVRTLVKPGNVLSDSGTTDTGVAVDVKVVTESDNDLLNLLSKLSGGSKDKSLSLLNSGVDLLDKRWFSN